MQTLYAPAGKARDIERLVAEVDEEIRQLLETVDVADLSRNNRGYEAYAADKFYSFVEMEKRRFVKTARLISQRVEGGRVCDLGCFIPYTPLLLARLGYEVTAVDRYEFYGEAFQERIMSLAARHGIELRDLDILNDDLPAVGRFDVVLLTAVVEHLHGSPRRLMQSVRGMLNRDGLLVFEVPNIAEFYRRLALLIGRSPLPPYTDYFRSEYPFFGHSREMTVDEVRFLLTETGFTVERLECYDYHMPPVAGTRRRVLRLLREIAPMRNKRQAIFALARR
jgi:SAM-dependent methyltransferase